MAFSTIATNDLMLKGFPNQLNNLAKLSRALAVMARLEDAGANVRDDAVLGEALVRDGVLGPRDHSESVDSYIARYRAQPPSTRPYQTSARGLREMFRYAGCLVEDSDTNETWLTPLGRQLATHTNDPPSPPEKAAWRVAVASIRIGDPTRGYSHPYRVLLRLLGRRSGLPATLSPLMFEANDDSDAELDRITALADVRDEEVIRTTIGGETASNWDNAKKVLPGIGEQLGDISRNDGQLTLLVHPRGPATTDPLLPPPVPQGGIQPPPTQPAMPAIPAPRPGRRGRVVTAGQIARAGTGTPAASDENPPAPPDPAAAAAANAARAVRLTRHNKIVRMLAKALEAAGATLMEDPFDCLATKDGAAVLFEVKTLDGTASDEIDRVRDALGQLLYYSTFNLPAVCPRPTLVALLEFRPTDAHIDWLGSAGILVAWTDGESLVLPNATKEVLQPFFVEPNL